MKERKWRKWTKAEVWILDETEENGSVVLASTRKKRWNRSSASGVARFFS